MTLNAGEFNTYRDLEEEILKITRVYDNTIEFEIVGVRGRKFSLTADDSGGGYDSEESWVPAPALVLIAITEQSEDLRCCCEPHDHDIHVYPCPFAGRAS